MCIYITSSQQRGYFKLLFANFVNFFNCILQSIRMSSAACLDFQSSLNLEWTFGIDNIVLHSKNISNRTEITNIIVALYMG